MKIPEILLFHSKSTQYVGCNGSRNQCNDSMAAEDIRYRSYVLLKCYNFEFIKFLRRFIVRNLKRRIEQNKNHKEYKSIL